MLLFSGNITKNKIKQIVIDKKINPLFVPSSFYQVDEIPKLGSGKVNFGEVKNLALNWENTNV